jgi:hypothetical protein
MKHYAIEITKNLKTFYNTPLDDTYYIGYVAEGLSND